MAAEVKEIYPLPPNDKPLRLNRWTAVDLPLIWKESVDGPLLDLTGFVFTMEVFQEFSKTAKALLEIPVTIDLPTSTTTLGFTTALMQSIDAGSYKFRLVGTRSSKPRTFWRSDIILED